jgi:hypothetical protein
MVDNTYIKIYDAEIVDNTIVIKKIIILDESDKIIREATLNKDMVNLLKNLQFSTKWHKVLTEFTIDTNPLELLK